MADPVEVERVARAAVALCADLLRHYHYDQNHPGYVTPSLSALDASRWDEWGRQVLAWQDQLDAPPPEPPVRQLQPLGGCRCSFCAYLSSTDPPPTPDDAKPSPHIVDWDGETREVTCTGCGVDVRYDHGPCPGKPATTEAPHVQ